MSDEGSALMGILAKVTAINDGIRELGFDKAREVLG